MNTEKEGQLGGRGAVPEVGEDERGDQGEIVIHSDKVVRFHEHCAYIDQRRLQDFIPSNDMVNLTFKDFVMQLDQIKDDIQQVRLSIYLL